ncbi:MAG: hypothetical protein QOI63_653, partial [Thermoplasmata archaeon]|nr:hypothetical protein [Thermoplasmata archaeon]
MSLLQEPALRHDVQVYDSEAFLVDRVARFLTEDSRASVIVIATPAHRAAFAPRLPAQSVMLDAEEALATFMVDDAPDEALFLHHVGSLVRQAARAGPVRAFGEMVAILAQQGNFPAAALL